MNKKFAYVFSIGTKVTWSKETATTLLERVEEKEKASVQEFINLSSIGNFRSLSTGEMIFRIW